MEKFTVHMSQESQAYRLFSVLQPHSLVGDFNEAQKVIQVYPSKQEVVVRWTDWRANEDYKVVFQFGSTTLVDSSDLAVTQALALIDLMASSFEDDSHVRDLLSLRSGGPVAVPDGVNPDDYLVGNAGIAWRSLIIENWEPLKTC